MKFREIVSLCRQTNYYADYHRALFPLRNSPDEFWREGEAIVKDIENIRSTRMRNSAYVALRHVEQVLTRHWG